MVNLIADLVGVVLYQGARVLYYGGPWFALAGGLLIGFIVGAAFEPGRFR
jgi:hypothetical protein